MNKLIKNTIIIIGLLLFSVVAIFNIFVNSTISNNLQEKVELEINSSIELVIICIIIILMYLVCNKINKIKIPKKWKKIILLAVLVIYVLLQLGWITIRGAIPIFDQKNVYEAAIAMANGNTELLIKSEYLQLYPQQLTLATFYALIFKCTQIQTHTILQYLNAIANAFTILGILFITKQLGKKYEVSKINSLLISLAFIALPLLSTFVYGDLLGMPICLFAIYFIMRYSESKNIKYALISMSLMALGYILRMNNLIFILAISIYIILDILSLEDKKLKKILKGILVLILFITISILPATLIKNYWQNRLELNKEKSFPTVGFIYMGMQEGERARGWYDGGIFNIVYNNGQSPEEQYKEEITNRVKHFASNPLYCIQFYIMKTASMWTENTYAGLWYNQSYNFGEIQGVQKTELQNKLCFKLDRKVEESNKLLQIFQKSLTIIIFATAILVIVKNKKTLSNEVVLLITVFIGGFLFHTIWEAKSRYIIPYVVVLMPITAISLDNYIADIIMKIKNRKLKRIGSGETNEVINSNSNL